MKSTNDDLIAAYRMTTKLQPKHKVKLIALLTEDVTGKEAKPKGERKKEKKGEEQTA